MRVAFILSALQAGGAERVVGLISSAAIARGWQVTIITFDGPNDPIYHAYDAEVAFVRLGIAGTARNLARRVRALRRTLRDGHYDRVVSFLSKINVLALAASLGLPTRLIVCERNNPHLQPMHRGWRVALALLYARADAIILQTERSKSCLPARHRDRARVIPNPVTMPGASAWTPDARIIVAVGRLTEQKGFDLLLAAFDRIAAQVPGWTLRIWGEGQARATLERQRASLGLERQVELPGVTAIQGSWSEGAGMFVLSSRYEGFPNVLMEAMAAGLPVIAFDCDYGPAELVRHDRSGVLVPNGDIEELAQAMLHLIGDPSARSRLARAARKSSATYADERVADCWLSNIQFG